jgi:3' terminal RNA ribose 2'-O-methyltransferase Hen1
MAWSPGLTGPSYQINAKSGHPPGNRFNLQANQPLLQSVLPLGALFALWHHEADLAPERETAMLLTLTLTHTPATDLGFLLGKNPARVQSFPLSFGQAHVFYPEVSNDRCTAALLLDVDPVGLVRNRRGPAGDNGLLEQYVNDRPFVASSFLSVAISQVYGSALAGRSRERPELTETRLPFVARLAVVPCRGGERFLRSLFEPLGYTVAAQRHPLDDCFPQWGPSPYYTVTLAATCRLADLLSHLYVLVPVLDNDKHYWVGDDEVDKLMRHGEGWLATHPCRDEITRRYLKHQSGLTRAALARLIEAGPAAEANGEDASSDIEEKVKLNDHRLAAVQAVLKEQGARRVVDLGCGEGKLLRALLHDPAFIEVAGVDVSSRALEVARQRLERFPEEAQARARLLAGSLMYRDERLHGFDAAAVIEVIEHLDPPRLAAFERVLFEFARPGMVVLTTPNREYNVRFESLPATALRHPDHRFEWTRAEFQAWANRVALRFGYRVTFRAVGQEDAALGPPTQMAVFVRGKERTGASV